jgi:hypothetical protein
MQMEHAKCALSAAIKFLEVKDINKKKIFFLNYFHSFLVTFRQKSIKSISFKNTST